MTGIEDFVALLDLAPYSKAQRDSFDNDAVLDALTRAPSLARIKYKYSFVSGMVYPLFMAASLGASAEVVSLLCDACPEALVETDRYGRTPLHPAVEFCASADVVELLLERRGESAAARDYIGRTPLHCACAYSTSERIVRLLLDAYPRAVFETDNRGRLPLHIACAQEDSLLNVVRLLLERYPSAIHARNGKGATALELVEKGKASIEVLLSLTAVNAMLKDSIAHAEAESLVSQLGSMNWRGGVTLLLELEPSVVHKLNMGNDANLLPQVLSIVGHNCKLETMFEIVKDMPAIFRTQTRTLAQRPPVNGQGS